MNNNFEIIMWIFAGVGIGCTVVLIYYLIGLLKDNIKYYFIHHKSKHIIKHRFSKPPTAKCYCIDCKYHDMQSDLCHRHYGQWYTSSLQFCSEAEPVDLEIDIDNKENKDG